MKKDTRVFGEKKHNSYRKSGKKPQNKVISQEPGTFPMRINKYLAFTQVATRRKADELIGRGKVFINGKRAQLGDKVSETDKVELAGNSKPQKLVYFAYNKPKGMITSAQHRGEKDIVHSIKIDDPTIKLFPLGRLDKESHGLIILTNDGRITDALLNPEFEHKKTYEVTTKFDLRANFKEKMEGGVNIEGYITKPAQVKIINERKFLITIVEGKKHQIRRMCVALHNEVSELKRISIMNIDIKGIKEGMYKKIEGKDLEIFMKTLGFSLPTQS